MPKLIFDLTEEEYQFIEAITARSAWSAINEISELMRTFFKHSEQTGAEALDLVGKIESIVDSAKLKFDAIQEW